MEQDIRRRLEQRQYHEAFELLLSEYQNKVFRLAYSMLGNEALAEETAQEVFIRVWKALAGYRGQASLSTWIYSIARNTCLSALSASAARRTVSIDKVAEIWRAPAGLRAREIDLPLLLSQLPEEYRQVVVLFYMEEKSYEEVSNLLDLPMGTVKTYLHRARKELALAVMKDRIAEGKV